MRRGRLRWLAALTALTMIVASCADDDDDDDGAAGENGTESGTTAEGDAELASTPEAPCGEDPYTGNLRQIEAVDETTVRFTLCNPDASFPAKLAFSSFGIHPSEYLEETGGGGELVEAPIGTGPFQLEQWERGSQIVMSRFEDYWGEAAGPERLIFRWSEEAAQRLVELQSGSVDAIDNVGTDDYDTVQGDENLELIEREPLNVVYLGFNTTQPPLDNEQVRQALSMAIDRERIVSNFYPEGSTPAEQFLPEGVFGRTEGFEGYEYDPEAARQLLAEAGFPDGFDISLSYRDTVRTYLPQPAVVAQDLQAQLAEVGVRATIDPQESGTFIDNADAGNLSLHLLGWNADYPDATNFLDYHFGVGASAQFGEGFPDIHELLSEAGSLTDEAERQELYDQVNDLLKEHAPMLPFAHGGSAVAYKAGTEGAHASPLSNEQFAVVSVEGQDSFTWLQNGEPSGIYCADESDGEALRVCEQINESLLAFEVGGTEVVPSLATEYEPSEDGLEWTFTLRDEVTFHDGSTFDANDVVTSFLVQWDAEHPLHVGRDGSFTYFSSLFGGFLNPPPPEE